MPYGSVLTDVVQSSTAGTPPQFNDGNGTQTGTLCRAWVNFNGTGTVAIRASFNVSSITDNGTGDYTINFTNALTDANYAVNVTPSCNSATAAINGNLYELTTPTTALCRVYIASGWASGVVSSVPQDKNYINVSVFR